MRYSNIKTSIVEQFKTTNRVVPFITGAPGGGKSACARDALKTLGFSVEAGNMVEFVPSQRDPVDVLGTPNNNTEVTRWVPPEEFFALRSGVGPCALLIEELSDASVPMQNTMCQIIYDRQAGNLKLSDQLYIVATGNRTEDKSGANRVIGKLLGRVRRMDYDESLEDWTDWALTNGIDPVLVQFLRFRPGMLSAYDANATSNSPTPRNWERAALTPTTLSDDVYLENIKGDVGEGAAAEYVGFRRIYQGLPSIDGILLDPKNADVPADPATLYALTGALARKTTKDNFDRVATYLGRLAPEFNVMAVRDAIKLVPAVTSTRSFVEWANKHSDVLM